jgi:hypothetical protein
MGFKPQETIYKLTFEKELEGLEVRIKACTVGEFNKLTKAATSGDEDVEESDEMATQLFLSKVVSWNIENGDGETLPITREGLETLEMGLISAIIQGWQMAMVNVPDPLHRGSSNGRRSEEASLGLAGSSISQRS